jgi:hypothetical protein
VPIIIALATIWTLVLKMTSWRSVQTRAFTYSIALLIPSFNDTVHGLNAIHSLIKYFMHTTFSSSINIFIGICFTPQGRTSQPYFSLLSHKIRGLRVFSNEHKCMHHSWKPMHHHPLSIAAGDAV